MNQSTEKNRNASAVSSGGKRLVTKAESTARRKNGVISVGVIAVIVLIIAGVLIWAMLGYNGVYPNVTFAGTNIGGMSAGEARTAIESVLATYAEEKVEIYFKDERRSISVLDAGAVMPAQDAVQAALDVGRTGNVFQRLGTVVSSLAVKREVLTETEADINAINAVLDHFVKIIDKQKSAPKYHVTDTEVVINVGVNGAELDVKTAAHAIAEKIQSRSLEPVSLEEYLIVDESEALNLLDIYNEIYQEQADAHLDISGKEPKIVPHVTGISFDLAKANRDLREQGTEGETFSIPLIRIEPKITTEEFEELLFRDVLSEVKTTLNASNLNRTGNVRLSANSINGKILNPGDVFSYNETVGKRTYENGYKDASVYTYSGIEDQLGGGICQTSSTLYMNVIRAGLEIVERYNHSYTVIYTPLGEDATVYWGSLDFKFSNNRDLPVKIVAYQEKDYVVIRLLGTKEDNNTVKIETVTLSHTPYETKTIENPELNYGIKRQKNEGHSAYKVETYRVVYDENGKELSRVKLPGSRYKKLDRVLEIGTKGAPTGTVSPIETTSPSPGSTSPSASQSPAPTTPPSEPSGSPSVAPDDDSPTPGTVNP